MKIPPTVCLPLRFDPERLADDLRKVAAEEWVPHFNTQYYEGDWSVVSLRSTSGSASQIYPNPTINTYLDTPVLARCGYYQQVLASFQCPLLAVRFLQLGAGSRIREHTDLNLGYEDGEIRIHVPVLTNPAVEFYLAGERIALNEGEAWYLNLNLPHRVLNMGTSSRVHLVLDCVVNDWVRAMLEQVVGRGQA